MDCQRDTEARSPLQTQLFSLQGHTALVTGAGSGLGKYMAHALLHAGANLILVGRTLDRLEASAEEIFASLKHQGCRLAYDSDPAARSAHRDPDQNKRIACIAFDVSELKALPELVQKASQPFGAPDILVNAAGLNPRKPWNELTPEIWEYTLRLNLSAPFFLAQALVPEMMRQGWGRIINIASLQSSRAFPNGLPYGASKGGIAQLTRGMAEAWSRPGAGITANAIGNTMGNFHVFAGQAICMGLTTVVSQCVGAGAYDRARYYMKKLTVVAYTVMGIVNLTLILCIPLILRVYDVAPEAAVLARKIMLLHGSSAIVLWMPSFMIPYFLRAAGDATFTMVVSMITMWLVRVLGAYVIGRYLGYGVVGVWFAHAILDWATRSVIFYARYRSGKWERMAIRS